MFWREDLSEDWILSNWASSIYKVIIIIIIIFITVELQWLKH